MYCSRMIPRVACKILSGADQDSVVVLIPARNKFKYLPWPNDTGRANKSKADTGKLISKRLPPCFPGKASRAGFHNAFRRCVVGVSIGADELGIAS